MLGGDLNWKMIGMGVATGVVAIIVDATLGRARLLRLPPLAVGIGIYLPMSVTVPIAIGSVLGWLYDKRAARAANPAFARRMGVLLATGLIVGDSLANVAFAGWVAQFGLPGGFLPEGAEHVAEIAGVVLFGAMLYALYRYTRRVSSAPPAEAQ